MPYERILVVAPHPDDEVLGVGGTIARASAEGAEVYIVFVTRGRPPDFDPELIERGRVEAGRAHRLLGVHETIEWDFPAAALDSIPHRNPNAAFDELLPEVRPDAVFVPFPGDLHLDHRRVFDSALVACRPGSSWSPQAVYAYETLSETNWNAPYLTAGFSPNWFVNIEDYLDAKLEALRAYESQMRPFPHERSVEAARALARFRGSTVGREAAEAFVMVRGVLE